MIRIFRKDPTLRLRATRIYLVLVLACVFLLFSYNIYELYEKQHEDQMYSSSRLELAAQEIAVDLEHRIHLLAADCLSKTVLYAQANLSTQDPSVERLQWLRGRFNELERKHPIARHFFVHQDNRIIFPRTSIPDSRPIKDLFPENAGVEYKAFAELFKKGETREISLRQPAEAVPIYDRAAKLKVSDRLKAAALFRKARAYEKAGDQESAVQAYQTLLERYGCQYDESDTPYVIVLAFAPEQMAQRIFASGKEFWGQIYRDLLAGKWELSAGQAEIYLGKLEKLLGLNSSRRATSDFWEHLQMARALERALPSEQASQPFEITPRTVKSGTKAYQTFSTLIPRETGSGFSVRFSISMPWIVENLLPAYAGDSKYGQFDSISLVEQAAGPGTDVSDNGFNVPLPTLLPSWQLHIATETGESSKLVVKQELWVAAFAIFMFLCTFTIVLYLLIRVSGDIRWYRQRADFVSGVSHEFKTPLSLIRLYSETLANDIDDFSPEQSKSYIRIIARESERMTGLIDNVLDFSKMEQGRVRHELKEGDLAATVSQTVADYAEYLEWHGFGVKTSIWPNLPPVKFNAEKVSQVILNLLDNARKYSGKSRLIRVNLWLQEGEVVVEVQDKGLGISDEEKVKIFEPFYRASKGTEKGGSGLGLYLVSEVMKEHGGRIELESAVDMGSSFRLFFPVSGAHRAKARKHKGPALTVIDTGRGA